MHRLLVVFCIVACLLSTGSMAAEPETLKIGTRAPDFSLPGVDDKTYTLAGFADKDLLAFVFTCNHCPTALEFAQKDIAHEIRHFLAALCGDLD